MQLNPRHNDSGSFAYEIVRTDRDARRSIQYLG